jgi:hypothetical protein
MKTSTVFGAAAMAAAALRTRVASRHVPDEILAERTQGT